MDAIWLASRAVLIIDGHYFFDVKLLLPDGGVYGQSLNMACIEGNLKEWTATHDVFLILTISPNAKVPYFGTGTENNPYVII